MTILEKIRAEIAEIAPLDYPCNKRTPEHIRDMALEIIDKYAEQEPTDDATLKDIFCMGCEYKEQEPTGRWIEEDMFDGDVAYRCSECNELFWLESGTPKDNEYNFCPKCGEKLVEPKEREEL